MREDGGVPDLPAGCHVDVDAVVGGVVDAEGDTDGGEGFEGCGGATGGGGDADEAEGGGRVGVCCCDDCEHDCFEEGEDGGDILERWEEGG